MYVSYNFKNYRVDFSYAKDENKPVVTQCCIWETEDSDNETLLTVGQAKCAKEDNFNKVVGRKIALTSALKSFDKSFRTVVWDKYKATSRYVA